MQDYLIETIKRIIHNKSKVTFYQIRKILNDIGIDLDKKVLLKRLRNNDMSM